MDTMPYANLTQADLEDFLLTEMALRQEYVLPIEYGRARAMLEQHKQLWLVGPPGAGKRTIALALAKDLQKRDNKRSIYLIPRSVSWSNLAKLMQRPDVDIRPGLGDAYEKVEDLLSRLEYFSSNDSLRNLFSVDPRIVQWRTHIHDRASIAERIQEVISFLYPLENEYGNGLVLFLQAISEKLHEERWEAQELARISAELELRIISGREQINVQTQNIFIFPDTLGTTRLEQELEGEFAAFNRLKQGHFFVFTSSPEVFDEADREYQLRSRANIFEITPRSYSESQKVKIFEDFLQQALKGAKISWEQHKWAENQSLPSGRMAPIQEAFSQNPDKWLPIDIYRFVYVSLPTARAETDVPDLLARNADLAGQIKTWFVGLHPATRAFILTLVLFAGQPDRLIWEMHKKIVAQLQALDPQLAIFPLGILRQFAAPYVTEYGTIDFINSQVFEAISQEVARNYREYFIDQLELFATISMDHLQSVRRTMVRGEFTSFVGEVARQNPYDVEPILQRWADENQPTAVALALERTATHPGSLPTIFELLDRWLGQRNNTSTNLRVSVGYILWRILSDESRDEYKERALMLANRMVADTDPAVVSSAAFALPQMVRYIPLRRMWNILTELARRKGVPYWRVAWAITGSEDKDEAISLLQYWLSLENQQRHEVAYYALLIGTKLPVAKRQHLLQQIILDETKRSAFTSILFKTLRSPDERENNKKEAETVFRQAVYGYSAWAEWRITADILTDLQKREQDSNRDRSRQEQYASLEPERPCWKLLKSWINSGNNHNSGVAAFSLWTGDAIDLEEGLPLLRQTAFKEPGVFIATVSEAIKSGSHTSRVTSLLQRLLDNPDEKVTILNLLERSGAEVALTISTLQLAGVNPQYDSLFRFLQTYPVPFLEALASVLEGEDKEKIWSNLAILSHTEDFDACFYAGLQQGYASNLPAVWRATDALIQAPPEYHWAQRLAYALLGGSGSISEREQRLAQIMVNEPLTFARTIEWYALNNPQSSGFQEVVASLCAPASHHRQQVAKALAAALYNNELTQTQVQNILNQFTGVDGRRLMADVNRALLQMELSLIFEGRFSLNRFLDALKGIFNAL